jgi:hypothetical protein
MELHEVRLSDVIPYFYICICLKRMCPITGLIKCQIGESADGNRVVADQQTTQKQLKLTKQG